MLMQWVMQQSVLLIANDNAYAIRMFDPLVSYLLLPNYLVYAMHPCSVCNFASISSMWTGYQLVLASWYKCPQLNINSDVILRYHCYYICMYGFIMIKYCN